MELNRSRVLIFSAVTGMIALSALLTGCSAQSGSVAGAHPSTTKRPVVVTSNIAADWVQQVAGDLLSVSSLLPRGSDPHAYSPGPRDVAAVADAGVVFTIGLGLESAWFNKLVKNAAADPSRVVALGDHVKTIPLDKGLRHADETKGAEGDSHEQGTGDPHFWFDPREVRRVLPTIVERLAALEPDGRDTFSENADAYARELDNLHTWISQETAKVPVDRRLLVTSHDTLGYFAKTYGFHLVGSVIPGVTTTREPTPVEMGKLVIDLRQQRVAAIFAESIVDARLARRISEEAGVKLVTGLHTDSLGQPGSSTESYLKMMRLTVSTIVDALK